MEVISSNIESNPSPKKGKNKGEWSELLVLYKLMLEQKLYLADEFLNKTNNFFNILKLTRDRDEANFVIKDKNTLIIENKLTGVRKEYILKIEIVRYLEEQIKEAKGSSFRIEEELEKMELFGITSISGGSASEKSDIILDFEYRNLVAENQGFSIKSFLGANPTLLNASGQTNFVYMLDKNILANEISLVNSIATKSKIKDRLFKIRELGSYVDFYSISDTMQYNLKMVDCNMPQLISLLLLYYYENKSGKYLKDIVNSISDDMIKKLGFEDRIMLEKKIKDFLLNIMLGCFSKNNWNGIYTANGAIIINKECDLFGFHIVEKNILEQYLFNNIYFETPSSARHKFGVIEEYNNDLIFKLNLQLRLG